MKESVFQAVRHMPRDELEKFAIRALLQLRSNRGEIESGNLFLAILMGFLLGTIVAASGFLLGLGLA
jgi:hypothetical protein